MQATACCHTTCLAGFLILGALLLVSPCAIGQMVEEDVISIPNLVDLCESCHGERGQSERADVPSLAGQSVDAMVQSMKLFYFQRRHCPQTTPDSEALSEGGTLNMCDIAGSLSQTEKMALAEHFAAQPDPEDPD